MGFSRSLATWVGHALMCGTTVVVLTGSVVLAASLVGSRAPHCFSFNCFLVSRRGARAIFAPMMACVTGWFDTHRSLGSRWFRGHGDGSMTMSPFRRWLVSTTIANVSSLSGVAGVMIPIACWCAGRRVVEQRAQPVVGSSDAGASHLDVAKFRPLASPVVISF